MARIPSLPFDLNSLLPSAPELKVLAPETVHPDLPPVAPEEIAFALALFVGIVHGQLVPPARDPLSADEEAELLEFQRILAPVCAAAQPPIPRPDAIAYETSLGRVLLVVWQLHRGHTHQASICARVLNFYLLTERTAGTALSRWIMPCTDDPKLVVLHPALIEALATIPLSDDGLLPEATFLDSIEAIAAIPTPQ